MLYYDALHRRIDLMYDPCCTHEHIELGIEPFKAVKAAFKKAIAYLHGKKSFTPDDLKHKDVKPYITETYKVLSKAVQSGIKYEIPAVMMNKLDKDVFLFSGMKVFNAIKEGELTLRDKDGHVKSWEQFKDDAKKIDSRYNENYLRAERRYAIDAAHAASEWERFYQDKDIFDLEYLTDNGPNVRDSHQAMEHTVLPMDDPFWRQYFPPNGWNCHCFTVRVPKGDKPHSNSMEAITKGDAATTTFDKNGNNSAAIFRFNAGQQQIIFPEKHPYYPQYCNGAKLNVTGLVGYAQWLLDAEGDRCKAKQVVQNMQKAARPALIKSREKEYQKYKSDDNYVDVAFNKNTGGLKATHKRHNFDKVTGEYEKTGRDILYNNGHKIILQKENLLKGESEKKGNKKPDGTFNDNSYDFVTVMSLGKYTIKNKFEHAMDKKAEVIIFYFPDKMLYKSQAIAEGLSMFRKFGDYQFKKIITIVENELIRE